MNNEQWIDNVYRVRGTVPSRFDALRLDKNERTTMFGASFFDELILKLRHEHLTAYPETEPLYDQLAGFLGVDRNQVVVTAGSDAGIKNCFELTVEPGSEVITLSPTFAMVDIYAELYRARQIKIGYNSDLTLQLEHLLESINEKSALIIIANPNSPTGTFISEDNIRLIVNKARQSGTVVLVDEAYFGFCKHTVLPLVDEYDNLVVARTFSKSFGLAGCRVGYLVAQLKLAQRLYRLRPMYEVNSFGVLAAMTILEHPELVEAYLIDTENGRAYIKQSLDTLGLKYIDTKTNFIHIDFSEDRNDIEKLFISHKILVRGGPGVSGYENYLRISLGPVESMMPVIDILNSIKQVTGNGLV